MTQADLRSPSWLRIAFKYEGLQEIPGPKHSGVISGWLTKLGAWWKDDETPWCGVFVAAVMEEAGFKYPSLYMRASSWLSWGQKIDKPVLGSIVVFDRKGGGHVGFVVGITKHGDLWVLGGNQRNAVNISLFHPKRIKGHRIPSNWPYSLAYRVPVTADGKNYSDNEA